MAQESNLDSLVEKVAQSSASLETDIDDILKSELGDESGEEVDEVEEVEEDTDEEVAETDGDESDEEDSIPDETPKAGKKATPKAEKLIVKLKKDKKALEDKVKQFEQAEAVKELARQKEQLKQTYVKQGYDEDTAESMADTKQTLATQGEQLKMLTFSMKNSTVLAQYPAATADIKKIMSMVDNYGVSVEQVCKILYPDTAPSYEKRAEAAVKGSLPKAAQADQASKAGKVSENRQSVVLSQRDQIGKAKLESIVGEKYTNAEYLELMRKKGR